MEKTIETKGPLAFSETTCQGFQDSVQFQVSIFNTKESWNLDFFLPMTKKKVIVM